MPNWIVSADVFSDFSRECGALDASEVRKRLQAETIAPDDTFLPGQGLSEADHAEIEALARHNGYSDAFRFWRTFLAAPRAPRSLTHKHQAHNSMISVPQAQADGVYRAELLICSGNELISDHVTGQHVQGMVLIEACRQMFIAVSELCHMDHEDGRRSYVVFNRMEAAFKAFTFPLPAVVEYRALSRTSPRPDRLSITAELNVVQNDKTTTTLTVDYTLFHAERLRQKEVAMGIEAVNAYAGFFGAAAEEHFRSAAE
ncbi:AfsA-related hotdog domain-containing protein [Paenirhodobacter sp.]|uniref:AfsA-related hotdog domain-containing protein n=1 Tax=Paenirhodobacter sp. TaxID=1965326 RepID=UPI003B3E0278